MAIQEYYDKCLRDFNKTLKECKQAYARYLEGKKAGLIAAPLDLSALEECYEILKNPPEGMNGTEDFLFVEGTAAEKFKKQYKALKYARAARYNLKLEEGLKKDFSARIRDCQNVEKQISDYLKEFTDNVARDARYPLESMRNRTIGLSKGEELGRTCLNTLGGVLAGIGFLSGIALAYVEMVTIALPMFLLGAVGCVPLYFGLTMKSRKVAARDRGYEVTFKEFEKRIAATKAEIEKECAAEINEIKEKAKGLEEELRAQYRKVLGWIERNKNLADGKLAFLPNIADEELDKVLIAMDNGEATNYQDALRLAKEGIRQDRETARKIANELETKAQSEKHHKEMLAAQKAANDAQLQELERQTEAAEAAASAARQSAEANKQQAAAAANAAKSAKNAEKYGKQSAAAMRDIDDRLYRGDVKVEFKNK